MHNIPLTTTDEKFRHFKSTADTEVHSNNTSTMAVMCIFLYGEALHCCRVISVYAFCGSLRGNLSSYRIYCDLHVISFCCHFKQP